MMKKLRSLLPQLSDLEVATARLGIAVFSELKKCKEQEFSIHDHCCVSNLVAGRGLLPSVGWWRWWWRNGTQPPRPALRSSSARLQAGSASRPREQGFTQWLFLRRGTLWAHLPQSCFTTLPDLCNPLHVYRIFSSQTNFTCVAMIWYLRQPWETVQGSEIPLL